MKSLSPELPIFVVEGHDVGIYDSVDRAEAHLEPIDVAADVYTGYDALGRRLKIETDGKFTSITVAEAEATATRELEEALREYLNRMGELGATNPECDLPCLIEAAREHATDVRLRGVLRFFSRFGRGS